MADLSSRQEFRTILSNVVKCVREHLEKPGLAPFTPEEVHGWLLEITLDDIRAVYEKQIPKRPAAVIPFARQAK